MTSQILHSSVASAFIGASINLLKHYNSSYQYKRISASSIAFMLQPTVSISEKIDAFRSNFDWSAIKPTITGAIFAGAVGAFIGTATYFIGFSETTSVALAILLPLASYIHYQ